MTRLERRRHRMFVTRNREYHTRDDQVVLVRDRQSGVFVPNHSALTGTVSGALRRRRELSFVDSFEGVRPGDSLCIRNDGDGLITSTVERIERPPKEVVAYYPALEE
jgi:hypothetical protein